MPDAKPVKYPEVIARCDKCGGGFIYVNPAKESVPCPHNGCDGNVRRIEKASPESGKGMGDR